MLICRIYWSRFLNGSHVDFYLVPETSTPFPFLSPRPLGRQDSLSRKRPTAVFVPGFSFIHFGSQILDNDSDAWILEHRNVIDIVFRFDVLFVLKHRFLWKLSCHREMSNRSRALIFEDRFTLCISIRLQARHSIPTISALWLFRCIINGAAYHALFFHKFIF
jgi:hypothetical protein